MSDSAIRLLRGRQRSQKTETAPAKSWQGAAVQSHRSAVTGQEDKTRNVRSQNDDGDTIGSILRGGSATGDGCRYLCPASRHHQLGRFVSVTSGKL